MQIALSWGHKLPYSPGKRCVYFMYPCNPVYEKQTRKGWLTIVRRVLSSILTSPLSHSSVLVSESRTKEKPSQLPDCSKWGQDTNLTRGLGKKKESAAEMYWALKGEECCTLWWEWRKNRESLGGGGCSLGRSLKTSLELSHLKTISCLGK